VVEEEVVEVVWRCQGVWVELKEGLVLLEEEQ
jgi:hypothetical protein